MSTMGSTVPEFAYELASHWPPLAWLVICEIGSASVHVVHGREVETRPDWFCEAVWDAPFPQGDFDKTDLVYGSGGRRRQNGIIFVSAGTTVDRLQVAARGSRTFISNSLPCLLQSIAGKLESSFGGYSNYFEMITRGIEQPLPDLPVFGGSIRLVYYFNLLWDGRDLEQVPKLALRRDFTRFDRYTEFLRSALGRIAENMSSAERARSYSWVGTISRGYDSPTCSLLARSVGLGRVLTHEQSRPGEQDDGALVAAALKLQCITVNRLAWMAGAPLEPLFLAADAQGKEIMIAGAGEELRGKVLLTGHGGDTAWSIYTGPVGSALARVAHSGLSMTEYRLHSGFIHLPLPFMGLRQLPDIAKLSGSPEMKPWDIGGEYNRPICRRLLEEAGVRRELFGLSKAGASIRFLRGEDAWSRNGKRAFFHWMKTRGHKYNIGAPLLLEAQTCFLALEISLRLHRASPRPFNRVFGRLSRVLARRIKQKKLNDLAFAWALETVGNRYRRDP
jgi:hypothetical protein